MQRNRLSKSCLFFLVAALCCAWVAPVGAQEASFTIIVNPDNPVTQLERDQVARMFLGKVTSWSHGAKVVPVDRNPNASVRDRFSKQILGKSTRAIRSYWQQQIFSGRGVPPTEMVSDEEVMAYVARNPGAIGYVATSNPSSSVKKLTVLH